MQSPLAAFRHKTGIEVGLWIGTNPAVAERLMNGEADLVAMEWWDGRRGYQGTQWAREPLLAIRLAATSLGSTQEHRDGGTRR